MTRKTALLALLTLPLTAAVASVASAQTSRDYIAIVGSSTVYPFTTTVAEQFGKGGKFKTPKVESTGTGGGFKLFCAGVGVQYPDISNASRAIKPAEQETCAKAGVRDILEVKIGYDGIVLANSSKGTLFKVSRRDLYQALAGLTGWFPAQLFGLRQADHVVHVLIGFFLVGVGYLGKKAT